MVTIKDVAKEAGVGVGTVSRYVNGDSSVKTRNRIAIDDAIKKLGYQVNTIARSMKTQKTMTIGVIVHSLSNMFSMKVIESIEKYVSKAGYSLIIAGCGSDVESQYEKIIEFKKRMVDGLVIMPAGRDAKRVKNIIGDMPCILVDRLLNENILDSVTVDNETMVYEKMCEAIRLGFKKFAILEGPRNISNAVERKNGFFKALSRYNLECEFSIEKEYTVSGGYNGMVEILEKDVDAVFVSNNDQLLGSLKAINGKGKKIYVVGFDGIELPWLLDFPCSFIPQPIEEIGKQAAQLLLERFSNKDMKIKNIVIREW